jgi:SAM-dependent methyltransferase
MQTEQFQLHAEIEQRHWWFVARRTILRRLLAEVCPPSREKLVIDVGCGTGANLAAVADEYRCAGIDTSAEAVALARQRFPGVQFLVGQAPADLGPLAAQADALLLMDVLEHVADDQALFERLLDTTQPGSHLIVTVPADMALWSAHDESFGHFRRYDRPSLERLWTGLPVTVRLISYFNSRLYWVIRATRAWNRLRGHASGAAGTDFWLPRPQVNRWLESILAGEADRLLGVLRGSRSKGYQRGASLVAVIQKSSPER